MKFEQVLNEELIYTKGVVWPPNSQSPPYTFYGNRAWGDEKEEMWINLFFFFFFEKVDILEWGFFDSINLIILLFNHGPKLNSDKFDSVDSYTQLILQVLENYSPHIFMYFGERDMP